MGSRPLASFRFEGPSRYVAECPGHRWEVELEPAELRREVESALAELRADLLETAIGPMPEGASILARAIRSVRAQAARQVITILDEHIKAEGLCVPGVTIDAEPAPLAEMTKPI